MSNTSKDAAFDFKAVLDEKTYTSSRETNMTQTSHSDEQKKMNNNDLMSKERRDISGSNSQEASNASASEKTDTLDAKQVEKTDSKDESVEVEKSKALKAVKRLLKELGLLEEEVAALLENLPQEQVVELEALMQSLMNMNLDASATEGLQANMVSMIEKIGSLLENMTEQMENMEDVPQELLKSLELLTEKVQTAATNLKGMETSAFKSVLEEVKQAVSGETEGRESTVEVVDYKVTSSQASESTQTTVDSQQSLSAANETQTSTEDDSEDTSKQETPTQTAQVTESAEQTPVQVDQSLAEMIKVESAAIRGAQPLEAAAGRVKVAQNIMSQVLDGAKLQLNPTENGQEIMMKLRPENLGNVNLKISVEKGILMAEFQVESQVVKEALESNMADLKQALSQKGYSIEGMQVSVGQEQTEQQSQFENQFFSQSRQRKYFFGLDEELDDIKEINKTLAGLQSTFEYLG
jgi:flagellar hook-length control protein FliK